MQMPVDVLGTNSRQCLSSPGHMITPGKRKIFRHPRASLIQNFPISTTVPFRAMHFSAKRGIAIACRLSVCLSVRLSVTLVDCDHIGWNTSKIISALVSLGCSLSADPNIMGLL